MNSNKFLYEKNRINNKRVMYNCKNKYREIPLETLWEEMMVFDSDESFKYETIIKVDK